MSTGITIGLCFLAYSLGFLLARLIFNETYAKDEEKDLEEINKTLSPSYNYNELCIEYAKMQKTLSEYTYATKKIEEELNKFNKYDYNSQNCITLINEIEKILKELE